MHHRLSRTMLLGICLVALIGCTARPAVNVGTDSGVQLSAPPAQEGFSIGILGDRTTGDESGLQILRDAVHSLNLLKPDLVIHIGDLVPGYGRDMAEWEGEIAKVKAILGELKMPLYTVAGNHDVITGTDDPSDRRGEALYKKHFAPLYYSFDYRDVHFVVLDSEETLASVPRFSDPQLDWLRQDLSRTRARQVYVFVHKPAWEYPDSNWEAVHQILRQHPVKAVFAGHLHHYYQARVRDGIHHYVLGVTGGRLFSPPEAGGIDHFSLLRITPETYTLNLVPPHLPFWTEDLVKERDAKMVEKLRLLKDEDVGPEPLACPETGEPIETLRVRLYNPLDIHVYVTIGTQGIINETTQFKVEDLRPGEKKVVSVPVRITEFLEEYQMVPEMRIYYDFEPLPTDISRLSRGYYRTGTVALNRRIPLQREMRLTMIDGTIAVGARPLEKGWESATRFRLLYWPYSDYESGEKPPWVQLLATRDGLYFIADLYDEKAVYYRSPVSDRMLSDAIEIGAFRESALSEGQKPDVIVMFPFAPADQPTAVRAAWDVHRPHIIGPEPKVQAKTVRLEGDKGWRCEGFVPWEALLGSRPAAGETVRFNMGYWDNDGDLFTEFRAWAPYEKTGEWGKLTVNP